MAQDSSSPQNASNPTLELLGSVLSTDQRAAVRAETTLRI